MRSVQKCPKNVPKIVEMSQKISGWVRKSGGHPVGLLSFFNSYHLYLERCCFGSCTSCNRKFMLENPTAVITHTRSGDVQGEKGHVDKKTGKTKSKSKESGYWEKEKLTKKEKRNMWRPHMSSCSNWNASAWHTSVWYASAWHASTWHASTWPSCAWHASACLRVTPHVPRRARIMLLCDKI